MTILALLAMPAAAHAQRSRGKSRAAAGGEAGVRDFPSAHFLVHTDLSSAEAAELLRQMESMLKLIATYWGRPPSGILECYVAKNLDAWPPALLATMEPEGVAQIRAGAGVVHLPHPVAGRAVPRQGPGLRLHQARRAAARVGARLLRPDLRPHRSPLVRRRHGRVGPLLAQRPERRQRPAGGHQVSEGLGAAADGLAHRHPGDRRRHLAGLCLVVVPLSLAGEQSELLGPVPGLGPQLLAGKDTGFRQVFGSYGRELHFEFGFFLEHLEAGYRVDLTAWDWKKKFVPLENTSRTLAAVVLANHGWQPSGLTLSAGGQYAYEAVGTWRPAKDADPVDAAGDSDGLGRLVGVAMSDYKLGEEFVLGVSGTFRAPAAGNLYLRAKLPWKDLAEASGRMTVKLRRRRGRMNNYREAV